MKELDALCAARWDEWRDQLHAEIGPSPFQFLLRAAREQECKGINAAPAPLKPYPQGTWEKLVAYAWRLGYSTQRGLAPHYVGTDTRPYGTTTHNDGRIYIREDLDDTQATRTLIHEVTHACRFHADMFRGTGSTEVIVESVAAIVSACLGVDASGFSLDYVGGWAEGSKAAIDRVRDDVIESASTILAELMREEVAA